jgi:hypothetical protein
LPCREDEFLEVLMKVEEGIEDGGGGCLCEYYPYASSIRRENAYLPCVQTLLVCLARERQLRFTLL